MALVQCGGLFPALLEQAGGQTRGERRGRGGGGGGVGGGGDRRVAGRAGRRKPERGMRRC